MTTVLVLGAGIMQGPSLRNARDMGWRTVAADANPDAPCRSLADRFALVDLKDREGMLALARSLRDGEGLDAVFTAGTDFSTTVSYVCERLSLTCIPLAAAERATDKLLMRRCLREAGVPCPDFIEYDGSGRSRDQPPPACIGRSWSSRRTAWGRARCGGSMRTPSCRKPAARPWRFRARVGPSSRSTWKGPS